MSDAKKLILIIGATGAQGIFVADALLAPRADGTPSPYRVRGLTRDPSSKRAQDLAASGVELVKGTHLVLYLSISRVKSTPRVFRGHGKRCSRIRWGMGRVR